MWVLMIAAMFSSLMILSSGTNDFVRMEMPGEILAMRAEAGKLAWFKKAADKYIAANPTVNGSVYWTTIKTVPGLPSGIANAAIDPSWKIVANGAGQYTLCATLRDGASQMIADEIGIVDGISAMKSSNGKIVFVGNPSQVEAEAAKC